MVSWGWSVAKELQVRPPLTLCLGAKYVLHLHHKHSSYGETSPSITE